MAPIARSPRASSHSLTDKKVNAVKPKDKPYLVSDGGGLDLDIMPCESKVWR